MKIAYIDAYHAGSHATFYRGWSSRSEHDFTLIPFPGRHWKWRMRHSAYSAARVLADLPTPDLIVATDMCNVAEMRGHLPERLRAVPLVQYFHEHQLTYPTRHSASERDDHFAMSNLFGALAADEVWCNSAYTRDSMVQGLREMLRRMPTPRVLESVDAILKKAVVLPPGVDDDLFTSPRLPSGRHPTLEGAPIRLLWNARWEHDKGPEVVAEALRSLGERGVRFTCDLVGPATDAEAVAIAALRDDLGARVHRFGTQDRASYRSVLAEVDVVISAARHEFFGIGVVEAVASGALPVVPHALAYPEVLAGVGEARLWGGGAEVLAGALEECAEKMEKEGSLWSSGHGAGREGVRRYAWSERAPAFDRASEAVRAGGSSA